MNGKRGGGAGVREFEEVFFLYIDGKIEQFPDDFELMEGNLTNISLMLY